VWEKFFNAFGDFLLWKGHGLKYGERGWKKGFCRSHRMDFLWFSILISQRKYLIKPSAAIINGGRSHKQTSASIHETAGKFLINFVYSSGLGLIIVNRKLENWILSENIEHRLRKMCCWANDF
jgi:hypothetical protein